MVMHQDNLSSMILENNERLSSGNCTKHIRVRKFMIKDRIEMGDLKIKYCPTGQFCLTPLPNHFKERTPKNPDPRFRAYGRTL